ncbi:MAG: hypothetical protein CM1200mP20_01110 [Pseudomonadota bacterium]|nr:MAG: hypothetical protein CM1200mP20_01110 [Pseudomonadota bacterium]
MANRTYDVVVVGAGILGSTTAYYLKKNGVSNVLLSNVATQRPAALARVPLSCARTTQYP